MCISLKEKREESLKFWLLRCSTIQTTNIHRHQLKISQRQGWAMPQIGVKAFHSGEFDALTRKADKHAVVYTRNSSLKTGLAC